MKKITVDFTGIKNFISTEEIDRYQEKVTKINDEFKNNKNNLNEMLGWLDIYKSYSQEDIMDIKKTAKEINNKADVFVVIGIGGSYLGAKAVIELFKPYFQNKKNDKAEIIFAGYNMSGEYLEELVEYLKDKEVCINVISKSGKTLEPAITFRTLKTLLEDKYGIEESQKRIFVTTDKEKGLLTKIADKNNYKKFIIPSNIGGRYSVLTPVGLLPISVAGIDIQEILVGMDFAKNIYNEDEIEKNDCYKYAIVRNLLYLENKNIEILSSFEPKMHYFIEWFKQLFGETEGKDLKGIFPMGVNYSTDLHSLGQMIQEGKRNIFETNLNILNKKNEYTLIKTKEDFDELSYLEGVKIDDINEKAFLGTVKAHIDGGVPNIIINIPEISEFYIGQLIFFFEKSCAISAKILGVNPFNQPGVEAYKQNMMQLINKYKES